MDKKEVSETLELMIKKGLVKKIHDDLETFYVLTEKGTEEQKKHQVCPSCLTELKSLGFPLDRPYTIYECSCSFWRFEDGKYHHIKKKE